MNTFLTTTDQKVKIEYLNKFSLDLEFYLPKLLVCNKNCAYALANLTNHEGEIINKPNKVAYAFQEDNLIKNKTAFPFWKCGFILLCNFCVFFCRLVYLCLTKQ